MSPLAEMRAAARAAGDVLRRCRASLTSAGIESKGRHDYVTSVDREAEDAIVAALSKTCPGVPFLAEESPDRKAQAAERFIVDPLDGTTNYIHGYPCYAVSIGFESGGRLAAGVIHDPVRDEMFAAEAGRGATCNDAPIAVSRAGGLDEALLVTGFPFKMLERLDEYLEGFRLLVRRAAGVRRDGSAALDLAYVACGRFDAFWELGLSPWDVAAGAVLVREAGGTLSDFAGGENWLHGGSLITGNPAVHAELLATLREAAAARGGIQGRE